MYMYDQLITLIHGMDLGHNGRIEKQTSLIRSGLLDSMALFHLALWIENEINRPMDLTAFDISKEWDTPEDILNFIERHRDQ